MTDMRGVQRVKLFIRFMLKIKFNKHFQKEIKSEPLLGQPML